MMKYTFLPSLLALLSLIALLSCQSQPTKGNHTTSASARYVDQVYPLLDAANSRWFFFNSATRPFGMVNLSPDTQLGGTWGSGYRYDDDTIKGFSHIHAWQLAGVSLLPVSSEQGLQQGLLTDYYSPFEHADEVVKAGYHSLKLDRYDIDVELTSTCRVGFHNYHFSKDTGNGLLLNLSGQLGPSTMEGGQVTVDGSSFFGEVTNAPTIRRPKPTTVYFYAECSSPVHLSSSQDGKYLLSFGEADSVLMKVAISYVSAEGAKNNLEKELPHWDFDRVVQESQNEWEDLLGRIEVETSDSIQMRRFYTDLWHSLQGRRIISDVNGKYPDNTGGDFRVGQIPLGADGKPEFNHYNSDSFWGAQWTLSVLWGLVYPDIYEDFVRSLMQYYRDGGYVPRGPSGGNYTHVMTGASSTPFIVSAYQKGIGKYDLEEMYGGLKKNHMPGGTMARAGYEHNNLKGGGLDSYIQKGYVAHPNPFGKFGFHQDGASLTMEYAYQDWTLAQMAKGLGKTDDVQYFTERSKNYQNQFDPQVGWMRPRDEKGDWMDPFDPYMYEHGFNESNGAQSTWFVPHDVVGLARLMGGNAKAIAKLDEQFEQAATLSFTSGSSHARERNKELRRIPINYGNQPSIQTAFIFHALGAPEKTQYWSRRIAQEVYNDLSPQAGYSGDEDQGLMGALSVLLKLGLFQLNGGTEENPAYQINSPIFERIKIKLHPDYYSGESFEVLMDKMTTDCPWIEQADYQGEKLSDLLLTHDQITNGGVLKLSMKCAPE